MSFKLKLTCSNMDEFECDSKPRTERTPRWVDIENPQEVEKIRDKTESCYTQNMIPVVNEFHGKSDSINVNESIVEQPQGRPYFKSNTSGTNSLDTSFCTP
jgi:type IV pilus biogenesis protein CpaD/CtpE